MQPSPFLRCLDCGVCVAIRLVRFGYNPSTGRIALRVAPISPFPLAREPTVTAWRGDNTRSRHNQRHFSYYATSLCAPATQQNATHSRTTHTRAPARQKQANLYVNKKDESTVFGVWEKGTQRPKGKRLQLVVIVAKWACV